MEPVYNIRVAGLHTYFVRVGASDVLVHNKGGDPEAGGLFISNSDGSSHYSPPSQAAPASQALAAPPPPGPAPVVADAKLSPREQLKATLRQIIENQQSLLTKEGVSDYLTGYGEGFIAGARARSI